MKTDKFNDYENLLRAAEKSCNGVRWKSSVQNYEINLLRWVSSTKRQVDKGTYRGKGFKKFTICERGKMRNIQSVHISERAVQKSLCNNVLKPVIVPKLITANAASLEGRGTQYALNRLKQDLAYAYKKWGRDFYILTIDDHDFFNSIRHDIVLEQVKPLIDNDSYHMLETFVNAFDGDTGLGLGSEISQILAVFYQNEIDHYIKEHLHIKGYGRYMDDSYLIHPDKSHLKHCLNVIRKMSSDIGITLNEKKTVIQKRHFLFLKKRISITDTGKIIMRPVRKSIVRERRKLKKLNDKLKEGDITVEHYNASFQAWEAYMEKINARKTLYETRKLKEVHCD